MLLPPKVCLVGLFCALALVAVVVLGFFDAGVPGLFEGTADVLGLFEGTRSESGLGRETAAVDFTLCTTGL